MVREGLSEEVTVAERYPWGYLGEEHSQKRQLPTQDAYLTGAYLTCSRNSVARVE